MKKRSGASSTNEPPEPLVLFVDRSLGNKVVAGALRFAGVAVEIHDDHFPTTAHDEDWLQEVGRRGWIVLTKDRGIRYRAPLAREVLSAAIVGWHQGARSEDELYRKLRAAYDRRGVPLR